MLSYTEGGVRWRKKASFATAKTSKKKKKKIDNKKQNKRN